MVFHPPTPSTDTPSLSKKFVGGPSMDIGGRVSSSHKELHRQGKDFCYEMDEVHELVVGHMTVIGFVEEVVICHPKGISDVIWEVLDLGTHSPIVIWPKTEPNVYIFL